MTTLFTAAEMYSVHACSNIPLMSTLLHTKRLYSSPNFRPCNCNIIISHHDNHSTALCTWLYIFITHQQMWVTNDNNRRIIGRLGENNRGIKFQELQNRTIGNIKSVLGSGLYTHLTTYSSHNNRWFCSIVSPQSYTILAL